jgi:hypothetical protein
MILAQCAYNHRLIPAAAGAGMGLQDPAKLAGGIRRATAEATRKAANAAAPGV